MSTALLVDRPFRRKALQLQLWLRLRSLKRDIARCESILANLVSWDDEAYDCFLAVREQLQSEADQVRAQIAGAAS